MFSTLIDVATLSNHLSDPNWVIVDCRFRLQNTMTGRHAYEQAHIPSAVYAHLDDDLSSASPVTDAGRHPLPSPEQMTQLFSRLGITTGVQVVIYDDFNHAFASRLWWMLHYMGHDAAAVLDGGWSAWVAANGAQLSGVQENKPAVFTPQRQTAQLVQIAQVPHQTNLIDSRAPERYRGETEPLDPIAGHIPSAVNYFFTQNLTTDGQFKSADMINSQLASLWPETGVPTFYCGSGVTACVNVLAATHAGLPRPKLYVGSWSEWCRTYPDSIEIGTN